MVKVLRPLGVFSRCVHTAIVGITLVEKDAAAAAAADDDDDDDVDFYDCHEQWSSPMAPPPPPPRFVHDPLWMLEAHLLHRAERVHMEMIRHNMQVASAREATVRLYDQAVAAAVSNRRAARRGDE